MKRPQALPEASFYVPSRGIEPRPEEPESSILSIKLQGRVCFGWRYFSALKRVIASSTLSKSNLLSSVNCSMKSFLSGNCFMNAFFVQI